MISLLFHEDILNALKPVIAFALSVPTKVSWFLPRLSKPHFLDLASQLQSLSIEHQVTGSRPCKEQSSNPKGKDETPQDLQRGRQSG